MNLYKIDIQPQGTFYTPIKGDMFFGLFCCTLAEYFGSEKLASCLNGYTENSPFIIFSDAFPCGYFPKPTLPYTYFKSTQDTTETDASHRKELKRRVWLPESHIVLPTSQMTAYFEEVKFKKDFLKTSNRINQKSNHASGGKYSAYTIAPTVYNSALSIYMLIDETKLSSLEVEKIIAYIGLSGFGKKASSGGGKFSICSSLQEITIDKYPYTKFMTLSPCVPQPELLSTNDCFYKIFVRFGRHGNINAVSENPFKKPVITIDTGAVLTFNNKSVKPLFTGKGIIGTSLADNRTVYQGYAPLIPILAEESNNATL